MDMDSSLMQPASVNVPKKKNRPKLSSRRHRATGRRSRPKPHRFGSISSSQTARQEEEVKPSPIGVGNPSQCSRFWETYGRACEWQRYHQIAYWKSRAFALENENNKLCPCVECKANLCQSNTQQCEPNRSRPRCNTQQYTLPNYSRHREPIPSYCMKCPKEQIGEQSNNSGMHHEHTPVATDQPSTSHNASTRRRLSSRYKPPKIDVGIVIPSTIWEEANKARIEVSSYLPTIPENGEDANESFEFEIDEEMMAFLEQSMKHKLELSERRKREKIESDKEKLQHEYESSLPPQHICKKRIAEMKLLYGQGAPKIIAMETSLKLTFERRLQHDNPKLWPVIPLNP